MSGVITDVTAWEALDSRGKPTVACRVTTSADVHGTVTVPSGASTGTHEAIELRDGGLRYGGNGVRTAVHHVNTILRHAVLGMRVDEQEALDSVLEAADSSTSFETLGANAVLAVSLATLIAAAADARQPLFRFAATDASPTLPMPMVNIFSGGAHAGGAIDIQDVLVVPIGAGTFAEAIQMAAATRAACAELLRLQGQNADLVADEGGLAAPLSSNLAALELVASGIERAGLIPGRDAGIAIDVAANQLAHGSGLFLRSEAREVTPEQWVSELQTWVSDFPIVSLEDILPDTAWEPWHEASSRFPQEMQLLGDDLFVTNTALLARGIDTGIGNAILVKPNQAGTVTRARQAVELAKASGYRTVISARSGETEDTWLADLAVGWATGQIKVGSTMRSERTAKWNRLLEIESETNAPLMRWGDLPVTPRN